jgi:DNA-directed RNA polymerase specialized sigma24 family protein
VGALAALIDTTAAASLAVARCVTGDEERAERATHDAYVEIWHRATQHRLPDQDVATWVLAVTHRHARALAA